MGNGTSQFAVTELLQQATHADPIAIDVSVYPLLRPQNSRKDNEMYVPCGSGYTWVVLICGRPLSAKSSQVHSDGVAQ